MPPCQDCMQGKQTVRISRGPPAQPTTRPLELIHIDTDGPWQVGSFRRPGNISPIPPGSVHFLALTDDFTGYVWAYFYKEKSQFLSCLKHYKVLVENQRKDRLKIELSRGCPDMERPRSARKRVIIGEPATQCLRPSSRSLRS
jgi:hypothetical protein